MPRVRVDPGKNINIVVDDSGKNKFFPPKICALHKLEKLAMKMEIGDFTWLN